METAITGIVYLDMLQQFLIPQLEEDDQEGRIRFQQDGASFHYLGEVLEHLSTRVPDRWIGRVGPMACPPRSPDLAPVDFFLSLILMGIECLFLSLILMRIECSY
jgi:hypothetical protein